MAITIKLDEPMPFLKLISLNIESDRHFDRIFPLFKREKPDVVMLQEVLEKDLHLLESTLCMKSIFTPLVQFKREDSQQTLGQAIFTNLAVIKSCTEYYRGHKHSTPTFELLNESAAEGQARALSAIQVIKEGECYCLGTTHFTWSPGGKLSEKQTKDLEILDCLLSTFPEIVLCGDFNAPRGRPIFDKLALKFKDNIPLDVTTTIDKNWHKAGDLQLVVDGLFSTPQYHVDSIRLVDNVSDHLAIIAHVKRTQFH